MFAKLLKEKKITQKELAEKLNLTQQCISKWANNIATPSPTQVKKISEILKISVDELITYFIKNENV